MNRRDTIEDVANGYSSQRYLPAVDLRGYRASFLPRDLSSAIALVFLAVPQGVAYAIIAGLPPAMGLYAASIPVIVGSLLLSSINPGAIKVLTYVVLLPLILLQAAGVRRYVHAERAVGMPLGVGIGVLYSITTISGPPLALMLNNQGLVREDFRASLAIVRIAESTLTAIAYAFLGLYSTQTGSLVSLIAPSVLVGVPLGALLIRRLAAETFRRVCMSFDTWVVGFGLSRTLIDLRVASDPVAYVVLAAAVTIDVVLLWQFFRTLKKTPRGEVSLGLVAAGH